MTEVQQATHTPEMLAQLDFELTASIRGMTLLEALYDERTPRFARDDAQALMFTALQRIANYMGNDAIVSKLRFADAANYAKSVIAEVQS